MIGMCVPSIAPAHIRYPRAAKASTASWRRVPVGMQTKRRRSVLSTALTSRTTKCTVAIPTQKIQLINLYSDRVPYHHSAIASLTRGSSGYLQFVCLRLRCGSTSPSTNSNVRCDIRKCFRHLTSSKWLTAFDQNTGPCSLFSFHTVLSDINGITL